MSKKILLLSWLNLITGRIQLKAWRKFERLAPGAKMKWLIMRDYRSHDGKKSFSDFRRCLRASSACARANPLSRIDCLSVPFRSLSSSHQRMSLRRRWNGELRSLKRRFFFATSRANQTQSMHKSIPARIVLAIVESSKKFGQFTIDSLEVRMVSSLFTFLSGLHNEACITKSARCRSRPKAPPLPGLKQTAGFHSPKIHSLCHEEQKRCKRKLVSLN